ncbi:alpha/beta hydrolase [Salinarimonas chemoclinalis]|uniref:alpha/beta hydrolase n=1 Tax=Salinarimonas chemoclinalis TaxID=3241599 RepID=UPI0035587C16
MRQPPPHPWIRTLLDEERAAPSARSLSLAQLRARAVARYTNPALARAPMESVETTRLPGSSGAIGIRVYRPTGPVAGTLVFLHGGGFTVGDLDSHEVLCRALAAASGLVTVAVDYRLAPEHPFPAGLDDCAQAYAFVADSGAFDGPVALAGDSAGGALACGVVQRRIAAGRPLPAALALIYPVTDHCSRPKPSYEAFGAEFGFTTALMEWFWDLYLPEPGLADHPEVSPLQYPGLARFPPTRIVTAGYDLLCDEGRMLAGRMLVAGVEAELVHYPDMNHGFMMWQGLLAPADEAVRACGDWLAWRVAAADAAEEPMPLRRPLTRPR